MPHSPDAAHRLPSTGWLLLLGCIMAVAPLSIDMYLPAFPAIAAHFGSGVELTLAGFFVGLVLGQLFHGPISDHTGRRRPLLIGLALYTVASFACLLADDLHTLIALRFVQAMGACAGMVLSRAIVRDRCDARTAAVAQSRLMLVMGLAPILAPSLGGWLLQQGHWQAIFATQGIAGALIWLACLLSLRESLPPQRRTSPLRVRLVLDTFADLLRERRFMGFTLSSGLIFTGMFAYIAGSPAVFITQMGLDPQRYALLFGANAAGFILSSQINAWLLKRYDMTRILNAALWVPMLASVAMFAAACAGMLSLPLLAGLLFLFIGSLGFIAPNAGAASLATQGQRAGAAASLQGALQFLLATVVSGVLAHWQRGDAVPLATAMVVMGVSAFAVNRGMLRGLGR